MAARRIDEYPLRMCFDDDNAEEEIKKALEKWSWWLHLDVNLQVDKDMKEALADAEDTSMTPEEKQARKIARTERSNKRQELLLQAEEAKAKADAEENHSSMFYLRKQMFPWLWKWIEKLHGTSKEAVQWRLENPQSEIACQVSIR